MVSLTKPASLRNLLLLILCDCLNLDSHLFDAMKFSTLAFSVSFPAIILFMRSLTRLPYDHCGQTIQRAKIRKNSIYSVQISLLIHISAAKKRIGSFKILLIRSTKIPNLDASYTCVQPVNFLENS